MFKITALAFTVLLCGTSICSCTTATVDDASENVESTVEVVDATQLSQAAQSAQDSLLSGGTLALGPGVYADFSTVEDGSIDVDSGDEFIYVGIVVDTDDVTEGCTVGEDALKLLDMAAYPDDDVSEGLGRLYETYNVSAHVDNPQGTLDLDGMREAGADTAMMWQ